MKKKESQEGKKGRVKKIIPFLKKAYPNAGCRLNYSDPLELLIATILAAQCTDERVNEVTKGLFQKYRKPEDYLKVPLTKLEEEIRPTGFFKNKARSIQKSCRSLVEEHGGEVPPNMEALVQLGGVGRKTANVVLGNAFGKPAIIVDTHVLRVAPRLGLTEESNPDKIEFDLQHRVPRKSWTLFSHLLAFLGRDACVPGKPWCSRCPVEEYCPYKGERR